MTENAGLLHRLVRDLFGLQTVLLVRVAVKTKRTPFADKPCGKITLMVVVTSGTIAGLYRRMHDLLLYHAVRVALETELRNRLAKHALVGRLMRIMTGSAITSHDWSMYRLLLVLRLMAHVAEVRTLLGQRNRQISWMLGLLFSGFLSSLMACCATVF